MYKTIRHGENSLQYTILPQNDDFRIDGKITGSGNTCGHKQKRARRRSFFAYLGLLFVCTVIVGAVLVPFLVSAECLPNPSDWFLRTRVALLDDEKVAAAIKQENKTESTIKAYPNINQTIKAIQQPTTTVRTELAATSDNIFTIPILSDQKILPEPAKRVVVITEGAIIVKPAVDTQSPLEVVKTTTTEVPSSPPETVQSVKDDVKIQHISEAIVEITIAPTMLNPLIFSTKKPIILPVLAKTNSIVRENGKIVDKTTGGPNNWIQLHWPTIYFQWPRYKTAIILPAILGLTLIGVVLLATVCLVSRNKRTIVATMKKRNPTNIEGAAEDNATLLTTGNLSDDD